MLIETQLNQCYTYYVGLLFTLNLWYTQLKNNKHIFATDEHHTYRKLPKSELPLSRMKHMISGGVTNWECLYACTNISDYFP